MNESNTFEATPKPRRAPFSGLAVTSMVFGIVGLIYSYILIGGGFGLAAIIIGVFDRRVRGIKNNFSTAGIILGILSLLICAALLVLAVVFKNDIAGIIAEFFADVM